MFFKTMELTLTLTQTQTDLRATAASAETAMAIAVYFRGRGWYDGVCHGQNRGACCGHCRADFCGDRRVSENCRGNGRGRSRLAVEIAGLERPQKLPCQLPRTSVVIAALPWQWPRMAVDIATAFFAEIAVESAANFRGFPSLVRRSLPLTEPWRVPWLQPWHLPWKRHEPWYLPWTPADVHGSLWQHQRKSTEVPRSLPRTYPPKSNIMCIRA